MVRLTEEMVLSRTKATDLENIKKLNCWASDLTDVSVVRKMPNIQILSLSVNQITTLEDFAHCPCLEELYIRKNAVADLAEVRHLEGLASLRNLWLAENPCAENPDYRRLVLRSLPRLQKLDNVAVDEQERRAAISESSTSLLPSSNRDISRVPITDQSTAQDLASHASSAPDLIRRTESPVAAQPTKSDLPAPAKQNEELLESDGLTENVTEGASGSAGNRIYVPSKYELPAEIDAKSSVECSVISVVTIGKSVSGKRVASSTALGSAEDADSARLDDPTSEDEDDSKEYPSEDKLSKKLSARISEKSNNGRFVANEKPAIVREVAGSVAWASTPLCSSADKLVGCESSSEFTWKQDADCEGRDGKKCKPFSGTDTFESINQSRQPNPTTASNVLQAMLCLINELDETGLDIVVDAVRNRRDACRSSGAAARGGGDSIRSSAAMLGESTAGAALKRSNGSMGLDETFD